MVMLPAATVVEDLVFWTLIDQLLIWVNGDFKFFRLTSNTACLPYDLSTSRYTIFDSILQMDILGIFSAALNYESSCFGLNI